MAEINYKEIVEKTIDELERLVERRDELDAEIAKKQQFLNASMNMLSEHEQDQYAAWIGVFETRHYGLTDAIRGILQSSKEWLTATQMRDKLLESSFDFGRYKTNPLASVHSVLKRLREDEVETTEIAGVLAWRWKGIRRFPRRKKQKSRSAGVKISTRG